MTSGLAKSESIVIDHRLNGRNGPVIDLRSVDSAGLLGRAPAGRRDVLMPPGRTFSSEDDDEDAPPVLSPNSGTPR